MVPKVVFAKRITCIRRSWRVGVFVFSWPFSAKSGREKWKERKCRYICPFATQDNQRISDARLFIREQEWNQPLLVKEFKKEWLPFPANKTIQEQSLRLCMKNTSIQWRSRNTIQDKFSGLLMTRGVVQDSCWRASSTASEQEKFERYIWRITHWFLLRLKFWRSLRMKMSDTSLFLQYLWKS